MSASSSTPRMAISSGTEKPAPSAASSARAALLSLKAKSASGFGAAASFAASQAFSAFQSSYRRSLQSLRQTHACGSSRPESVQTLRKPPSRSFSTLVQSFAKKAACLKWRSMKCSAASLPMAPWSPTTRGRLISGWQIERSTTGIPRAASRRANAATRGCLWRSSTRAPSPVQPLGNEDRSSMAMLQS